MEIHITQLLINQQKKVLEIKYNYSEKDFEKNSNNNTIEKIGIEIKNLTNKEIESEIENLIYFIKEKYNIY